MSHLPRQPQKSLKRSKALSELALTQLALISGSWMLEA